MTRINKLYLILIFCLLLVSFSGAQASAIKLLNSETGVWGTPNSTINLNSAINETELLLFKLEGLQGHKISLKLTPLTKSAITLRWYQVLQGVYGGAMDALQEATATGAVTLQANNSLLLVKTSVPASVLAGTYRWSLQLLDNNKSIYQATFVTTVYPFKIATPTITLQGNMSFKRDDISEDTMLALLNTMRSYDFNSIILPKNFFKTATIGKVERYVLDNFKYIRLSPRVLLSRNNTLAQELNSTGISRDQWLKDECNYVNNLMQLMSAKSSKNMLVYKLWDEPLPVNYPEVIYTYAGVHKCTKSLSLELTEQPSTALGDIADIWTVNINTLNGSAVQMARKQNDRIYLYANRLHDIQTNPQLIRNIGWLMGYFGLDGYHFWSVADWSNGTLEQAPVTNGERGTLFYWDIYSNKILPSLRMEMFRQGLDDMKLIEVIKNCSVTGTKKASILASGLLSRLGSSISKWSFNTSSDPGSELLRYRSELLNTAVACSVVPMN